ncbi:MAG: TIGR00289 family protein [Candidatus Aenigmatarchaeota archaeon]
MKLASLFSGGKDSTFATYLVLKQHKVLCLVTIISENPDSYMFHTSNVHMTEIQANAMGFPLITKRSAGIKEEELIDLKNALKQIKDEMNIEGVVSGAIASNYQKSRIDMICHDLRLKHFAPLWHKNSLEILEDMLDAGFKIIITAVAASGFDKAWLGAKLNKKNIKNLEDLNKRYKINISGEGGEFETLVIDCPLFRKKIKIIESEKMWDSKTNSGRLLIRKAKLIEKE